MLVAMPPAGLTVSCTQPCQQPNGPNSSNSVVLTVATNSTTTAFEPKNLILMSGGQQGGDGGRPCRDEGACTWRPATPFPFLDHITPCRRLHTSTIPYLYWQVCWPLLSCDLICDCSDEYHERVGCWANLERDPRGKGEEDRLLEAQIRRDQHCVRKSRSAADGVPEPAIGVFRFISRELAAQVLRSLSSGCPNRRTGPHMRHRSRQLRSVWR